jgi:hypothetical protein
MKNLKVIIVLACFYILPNVEAKCATHSYTKAMELILKEYHNRNLQYDVLVLDKKRGRINHNILDLSSKILQTIFANHINQSSTALLRKSEEGNFIWLNRSTIIFVEDTNIIPFLNRRIIMTNKDYLKFQHLLVIKKKTSLKKLKFVKAYEKPLTSICNIFYETIMYCINDTIALARNDLFHRVNKTHCKDQLVQINEFDRSHEYWTTSDFGLNEISGFNGCKLVQSVKRQDLKLLPVIYIYEIIFSLRNELNFTLIYMENVQNEKYTLYITMNGMLELESNNSISPFKYLFTEYDTVLIIPIGESYDSYEKFILPFDLGTWICCGVFFGGAFIIIFIINKLKNKMVQEFVYGRQVTSPAFNVLIAFFGQSQNILPRRNFARYLLMLLIIFCLIIRTGYQGVQFELIFKVNIEFKIF